MTTNKTFIIGLCLVTLICGCKKGRGPVGSDGKRDIVYEDKTPAEWVDLIQSRREQVRKQAAARLVYGGAEVVPLLTEVIPKNGGLTRRSIIRCLAEMGQTSAPAVPAICKALKDQNWEQRDVAAEALGKINSNPEETIPALASALKDSESRVRMKAAEAITKLRPNDPDIIAALAENLEDEDENVRAYSCDALGAIGPPANAAVPALQKLAQSENFTAAEAARQALNKINR